MSVEPSVTVYVITGAARGLGLGFVEQLVTRPDALIYAGVRDVRAADRLRQLAEQHSNVRLVQLNAESDSDHVLAARQVEAEAGRVDVLIANAAIGIGEPVATMALDNLRTQLEVNTVGPTRLFQHFLALLSHSARPRFISITSSAGSLARQDKLPIGFQLAGYGASKAAMNLITRRIHFEHANITALAIHPGTWARYSPTVNARAAAVRSYSHSQLVLLCAVVLQVGCRRMRATPCQSEWDTTRSARRVYVRVCNECWRWWMPAQGTSMEARCGARMIKQSCPSRRPGWQSSSQSWWRHCGESGIVTIMDR